jgi:hypothetical protein
MFKLWAVTLMFPLRLESLNCWNCSPKSGFLLRRKLLLYIIRILENGSRILHPQPVSLSKPEGGPWNVLLNMAVLSKRCDWSEQRVSGGDEAINSLE